MSRYDVEKIMASSTLLPGELARRNGAIESFDNASLAERGSRELDSTEDNINASEWRMTLYQSPQQVQANSEPLDHQSISANASNQNSSIFANFHGFFGMESWGSESQCFENNPNRITNDASLMAGDTTSSRERSANYGVLPMASMPPSGKFARPTTQLISWGPAASQLRNPVYAAWNDA
nr:ap2-like ethylen-responsive transcription factor crl5 [Erycina pusilla]